MIAPFWGDVDTRGDGGEVWYFAGPDYFIASFINTQVFNSGNYPELRNTFQVIITDGSSTMLDAGNNVGFFYQDMGWTTGDASDGVNGFGGFAATVGVNHGNGGLTIVENNAGSPSTTTLNFSGLTHGTST